MTYELAKKFKDVGFPFIKATPKYANTGWTDSLFSDDGMTVYIKPTLSELIEACGDDFGALLRTPKNSWQAMGGKIVESELSSTRGRFSVQVLRDAPEIAVANLWLQLNSLPK